MKTITLLPTDSFLVTGRKTHSKKRFRFVTTVPYHAFEINLFNGLIWLVRDNKRILLQRVQRSFTTIKVHLV